MRFFIKALFLFGLGLCNSSYAQPSPANPITPVGDDEISLENSLSIRDPFRRPPAKIAGDVDEGGNVPELERHDIEKLKLVGVITGPKKNKALITTPDGKMHVVTEKIIVGTRHGMIKRITANTVTVEEKIVNLLGQEEKIESKIEFENKDKKKSGAL